jgi:hypothetical protein
MAVSRDCMVVIFPSFFVVGDKIKIDLYFILSHLKNAAILKTTSIIILVLLYRWKS